MTQQPTNQMAVCKVDTSTAGLNDTCVVQLRSYTDYGDFDGARDFIWRNIFGENAALAEQAYDFVSRLERVSGQSLKALALIEAEGDSDWSHGRELLEALESACPGAATTVEHYLRWRSAQRTVQASRELCGQGQFQSGLKRLKSFEARHAGFRLTCEKRSLCRQAREFQEEIRRVRGELAIGNLEAAEQHSQTVMEISPNSCTAAKLSRQVTAAGIRHERQKELLLKAKVGLLVAGIGTLGVIALSIFIPLLVAHFWTLVAAGLVLLYLATR